MEISVIVPVYNVKPYLTECIESLCNQSFNDYEIILVDDGSTDGGELICDEFAQAESRIITIHQENQGLSMARNNALDVARGNYITFVDSDDCVEKEYLSTLYSLCRQNNAQISGIGHRGIKQCAKLAYITNSSPRSNVKVFTKAEALVEHLCTTSLDVIACGKLYSKDVFRNIRFPKGLLFEDMRTVHKLILQSSRVAFLDVPLYCYRKRKGSIGRSDFNEKWYGLSEAIDIAYMAARAENPDNKELYVFYALWKMAFINKMILGNIKNEEIEKPVKEMIRQYTGTIIWTDRIALVRKIELLLYGYMLFVYRPLYRLLAKGK